MGERVDGCSVLGAGDGVDWGAGFVGGNSVVRIDFETVEREKRLEEFTPGQAGALQCCAPTTEISAAVT